MLKEGVDSLLIITCSGGGGLLQAAKAKEQEVKRSNSKIKIIKKDLLKDWASKKFGKFCINLWDKAQKDGKVKLLELVTGNIHFADILFGPSVFFALLRLLMREDIQYVIDTQPLCTKAIVRAIRFHNFLRKKQVTVEKVLVDLPTDRAKWFFSPIKKLSMKDRKIFTFITIPPLLQKGQTANDFWRKYCKMEEKEICYRDYYVRESFDQYRGKELPSLPFSFHTQYKNQEEKVWMEKIVQRGPIQSSFDKDDKICFTIEPNAKVITILLGSQPAFDATVTYMTKMVELARKYNDDPIYIFAFCSHHHEGRSSLFSELCKKLDDIEEFPSHVSAIPLTFQNESVIASLFYRSDLTCTRSGGQTCMELMAVMQGEIWIHSESKLKGKEPTLKKLLKGIAKWEAGNALYLRDRRGAHIVTPELFEKDFIQFLEKSKTNCISNV